MGSNDSKDCCSTGSQGGACKGRLCGMIFKLIIVGLLACIATGLWEINQSILRVSIETRAAGH